MESSSFNHCNLPPWVIASRHFNDNPQPLEVQGVRGANRFLFARLDALPTAEERALVFNDYMSVKFQLHQWESQATDTARKSIRNSYLRFPAGMDDDSQFRRGCGPQGMGGEPHGAPPHLHKFSHTRHP